MMKNLFTIILTLIVTTASFSQFGYVPEKLSGDLYLRDLTNPTNSTLIGTGPSQLGGSDFALDGNFYAITESTGEFYQIDTSNASGTLIATITPPGSEFWSGMACDPTDGTMYICSTDGNGNSFFTIDLTSGATTLVGTNSVEDGVVGIAFTDDGQMYAIYLVRKFYKIDKTDASATYVGELNTACTAFPHHGLDFDPVTQTMYMVSYNAFTFDNEIWTVDVATGNNILVGSVGVWAGTLAVQPSLSADFTADNVDVCESDVVNFTDLSAGPVISWNWTFEGGTPATSTDQNPSVTYNTAGTYDVTLEVSDGSGTDILTKTDYISVDAIPIQADMPAGPDETCTGGNYTYTTSSIGNATAYEWMVEPADAGNISGTGTTGTFTASSTWTGAYTVKVRASNDCGDGDWSPTLSATLYQSASVFNFIGGGGYCIGGDGRELMLDGSETGFDYELYLDGTTTGTILTGTGDSLNFGYQTDQGDYTVTAFSATCSNQMIGVQNVFIIFNPGLPGTPNGPDLLCSDTVTEYITTNSLNADTLIWYLEPSVAGILSISNDMLTAEVDWSDSFTGTAELGVYGSNECAVGDTAVLEISVLEAPAPAVSGLDQVCEGELADYSTDDNAGSTYEWIVDGGTIVSGAGTYMITVEWGDPGMGFITVAEDNGTCASDSETFEVTIEECVGISENELNNVSIYPNPARNSIYISLPGSHEMDIQVVSMLGQLMITKESVRFEHSGLDLNIESLEEGIYFLHMNSDDGRSFIGRFIKAQ